MSGGLLRVVWLSCCSGYGLADLPDLQPVADNDNLRNDGDDDSRNEPGKFEKVALDEDEEPQEDDDARGLLVDDVPDDEREDHAEKGSAHSQVEAKHGLAGGCEASETDTTEAGPRRRRDENSLVVIHRAMVMIAHISLWSRKNLWVASRKARMPTVMVAQATRSPKPDSLDPNAAETARSPFPMRCQTVVAGRCSGSICGLKLPP